MTRLYFFISFSLFMMAWFAAIYRLCFIFIFIILMLESVCLYQSNDHLITGHLFFIFYKLINFVFSFLT
jgi:hypothetical protein